MYFLKILKKFFYERYVAQYDTALNKLKSNLTTRYHKS